MEETFLGKLVHTLVFLGICAAIIVMGWHEPLRYRFMSPEEIHAFENPPKIEIAAPVETGAWMHDSGRKTTLDQPPQAVFGGAGARRGALDR